MKNYQSQSGFTLLETMVNVAIFSMLILVVINFFSWTVTVYSRLQSMNLVTKNINVALSTMVYEIREAKSIYYPTSTSTQISLQAFHHLPDNEETTFVDIFLCGTQICIKREGAVVEQVTSDQVEVTDLNFTYISTSTAPSVYIDMSVRNANFSDNGSKNYWIDFHSAATLRPI